MQLQVMLRAVELRLLLNISSFDFRHIYYHTGRMPINYEDTQIFAKCLLNHVDTYKANTGLKDLMGQYYGAWAIATDHFDTAHMYDENVLRYAAIDACSCYKLYQLLSDYCASLESNSSTSI